MSTDNQFERFMQSIKGGDGVRAKQFACGGKTYEFVLMAHQLLGCPKWNVETDTNPPLAAAKALAIAKQFIATMEVKNGFSWDFHELALVQCADRNWIWEARYCLTTMGLSTGARPTMECWILMDGAIVQPTIVSEKK